MDYVSLFDTVPWDAVFRSMIQAGSIYILVLAGLKLVGRRVFDQKSPTDLVVLVLIAEACDLGLSDERAGYWGTIASVAVLLALGRISEQVPFLRHLVEPRPLCLYKNGRLDRAMMKKNLVEESDLDETAREYGLSSYRDFSSMMLEGDGHITGILHMKRGSSMPRDSSAK
jgi:uncharacterized membrane protein YcaP (DUF421 family)